MEKTFGELIGEMAIEATAFEELQEKIKQGKLVEVVRCGACKHYLNKVTGLCSINGDISFSENDYCSYGEWRE